MEGLLVRGRLVGVREPEGLGGFANVQVLVHRWNGEPSWIEAGYPATKKDSAEPTKLAADLRACNPGDLIDLAVTVKLTKAGTGTWTHATGVEVVEAATGEMGGSANGKGKTRAGATA